MILHDVFNTEGHPIYQELQISNASRQFDFLRSIVKAALAVDKPYLSQHVIKSLNFHAITCLHINAGEYRPCAVEVGNHMPPQHFQVQALMDDFVNQVNRFWDLQDPLVLASFVLWRLNYIHPFINGNGRTARASSYFVLCLKANAWLPGREFLPDLIVKNRDRYVKALQDADKTYLKGVVDVSALHSLLSELLVIQLDSAEP